MKYMDIIPAKKKKRPTIDRFEEFKRLMREREAENRETIPYRIPRNESPCFHKNCPGCLAGICSGVHAISCPCPSCSSTMMTGGEVKYKDVILI